VAAGRRRVVWAESARRALDEVVDYIARDSRSSGLRVLESALNAADKLAQFADRGRVVPELADAGIRETFVFRYRLMYRVEPERVIVLAFVHGARDFAAVRRTRDEG
jgi:toxin ParE1/3/4